VYRVPYDAFLSYSHAAEERLAPILQSALHRFAKPWYRRRQLHVFRDKTSLTASPALWSSIERALSQYAWFLLMASPEAAASAWVQKEINWWHTNRYSRNMLICLTGGEIIWDNASNDFDWTRTTALPSNLRGCFVEEPLYVDLRWARSADDLSRKHPQFLDAVADIAATLSGRSKEDLIGEDIAQFRRTRRIGISVTAAIAVLAVISTIAAYVATSQTREARQQARTALSRLLISQSAVEMSSRLDRPLLLSLAAFHVMPSANARGHLLRLLARVPGLYAVLPGRYTGTSDLAFSPDGRLLAKGGSAEIEMQLWDVARRQPSGPPLRGHKQPIHSVAFSPDGRLVATGSGDRTIILWDLATRTAIGTPLEGDGYVKDLAFAPHGGILASVTVAGTVTLWDTATFQQRSVWKPPVNGGYVVTFSPDGQTVVSGHDGIVVLRRVDTGDERAQLEVNGYPGTVAFSPDGAQLITVATSANAKKQVALWDLTGEEISGEHLDGDIGNAGALVFSPNGRALGGTRKGSFVVWKAGSSFEIERELPDIATLFSAVQFSPDGKMLAGANADGSIVLWDLMVDHPLLAPLISEEEMVSYAAFSPDGRILATVQDKPKEAQISLWDVASRGRIGPALIADVNVTSVALSPDGKTLAGTAGDRTIRMWDIATRKQTKLATNSSHPLAFSPDGTMLASGGARKDEMVLWQVGNGTLVEERLAHHSPVVALAFSPDGKTLASGSTDQTITLWDVGGRQPKREPLKGHTGEVVSVAFSPDGKVLASASWDRTLMLWDATTGRSLGEPLKAHKHIVTGVAFSPDGQTIASASNDGTVMLWDVTTRAPIGGPLLVSQTRGQTFLLNPLGIAFSRDGQWLAITTEFGNVLRWNVDIKSWKALACHIANRNLSLRERREYFADTIEYVEMCPGRFLPGDDFRLTSGDEETFRVQKP
jgi:WD40 repeat protein